MNKRAKLNDELDELESSEEIIDTVRNFLDEVESNINEAAELLSEFNLDNIENIGKAYEILVDEGRELY